MRVASQLSHRKIGTPLRGRLGRVPGGLPPWVLKPAPAIDMDIKGGRYYGRVLSDLTVSRASVGYIDDLSGNWSAVLANLPRASNKGLLVEEARTNSIRNNSMQGAAAGTPGTNPTNWVASATTNGVSKSIVGTGTENGIDYVDIRFQGTALAASVVGQAYFDSTTGIAASNGQTWASSAFVSMVGGSLANISTVRLGNDTRSAGGTFSASINLNNIQASLLSTLQRFTGITTIADATTASLMLWLQLTASAAAAIDITLRIGWPQLELGASVTSPIRTTAAAATRAADVISLTTPPTFGAAFTTFVKATPQTPTTYAPSQQFIGVSDGTNNNLWNTRRDTLTGTAQIRGTSGGTGFGPGASGVVNPNTSFKMAGAYAVSDQASSLNGAAVQASNSALTFPTMTQVAIGRLPSAPQQTNGYIERIAIWPTTRVPNAQLQSMTA